MAETDTDAAQPRKASLLVPAIILVVVLLVAVAVSTALFSSSLQSAKSGNTIGTDVTDGIEADATITAVDPLKSELTVRLAMTPVGSFDDGGLLAKPVTLYYDSVDGTKQIDFKANKPLGATDLSVPMLGGTVSSYPWDTYTGDMELAFVTVGESPSAAAPTTTTTTAPPGGTESSTGSAEGSGTEAPPTTAAPSSTAVRPDTLVPAAITFYKQVPAYTVIDASGSTSSEGVIHVTFEVKRAPTAIFFSLFVTAIMWALSIGVALIALSVIKRRRRMELAVISMMAVILFAMPAALRSFQPAIPPPGVLSDFYGFFWADILVAVSLVSMVVVYLRRGPD